MCRQDGIRPIQKLKFSGILVNVRYKKMTAFNVLPSWVHTLSELTYFIVSWNQLGRQMILFSQAGFKSLQKQNLPSILRTFVWKGMVVFHDSQSWDSAHSEDKLPQYMGNCYIEGYDAVHCFAKLGLNPFRIRNTPASWKLLDRKRR